jgi:folate-dependent phosphoribosylglycinamide formyltransferase PurN
VFTLPAVSGASAEWLRLENDHYDCVIASHGLRIVVLTNGNPQGVRILEGLVARGIVVDALVVESPSPRLALRRAWSSGSVSGALIELASAVRRAVRLLGTRKKVSRLAQAVVRTGPLNSDRMRDDIDALDPDLLVLGGMGILSEAILGVPRIGVVNAHPALLPWVRGNAVVGRSLERGLPVGCTLHYAEKRVDTGGIIDRRLVEVSRGASLSELEARANKLGVEMLVDVVADTVASGSGPSALPQEQTFPVSRRLSWGERRAVDRLARAGRARELFESGEEYTVDGSHHRLPVGTGFRFGPNDGRSIRPKTDGRSRRVRRAWLLPIPGVLAATSIASVCAFTEVCVLGLCC